MKAFLLGFFIALILVFGGAFAWILSGSVPVATSGPPLPLERKLAHLALKSAMRGEIERKSPILPDEKNLLAGAKLYRIHCAVCHGLTGHPPTATALGLFPLPPQLMPPHTGVTDDPVGETFWKVKNGIRLTGMPGFLKSLSEDEIWQVSELLVNADKLPASVTSEFEK